MHTIMRVNGNFRKVFESNYGQSFRVAVLNCDPFQNAINMPPYIVGLILVEVDG